jgi:WD40 repeat protein
LWDLETGHVIRTLQNQQGATLSNVEVSYSPDEKYIAVGGDLWDLAAGERLNRIEQAIGEKTSCWPSSVAFSPAGSILATGCFEGQLDLWSVPGGDLLKSFGGYQSWVSALAYSPDGASLAAIYWVPDFLVQVWQLPEGKASFTLTGGDFSRVAFSPDGQTLATVAVNEEYGQYGQQAGVVQLWSASDGKEIARLGLEDAVSVAFSPDSHILATGSVNGAVRLWEIAGSRLLLETTGHYRSVQRLAFTPNGTRLVSGSLDGTISVWGISAPTSP